MLFFLSKIVGFFINPLNVIFFLTIILCLSSLLGLKKLSKSMSIFVLIYCFFISYLPLSNNILYNLENDTFFSKEFVQLNNNSLNNFDNEKTSMLSMLDGILILGGAVNDGYIPKIRNQVSLNEHAERMTKAVEFFNKDNSLKIMFTGHSGSFFKEDWPEYAFAKRFLNEMGVPNEKIILEKQSRNSYENILYSKDLFNKDEKWLIISSASHMKRVKLIAKKLEVKNSLFFYPVDFQTGKKLSYSKLVFNFAKGLKYWNIIIHEYVGIASYDLLRKS